MRDNATNDRHRPTWLSATFIAFAPLLGAALLSACGGGDDGPQASPPPAPLAPVADISLTGKVMNGYLSGATVCIDENANMNCDAGELSAQTNAQGDYRLVIDPNMQAALDLASQQALRPLIAQVPAEAIDGATGQAVGSRRVLLTRPYSASVQSYLFTPLRTRAEQIIKAGVGRTDAEAVVRRDAHLDALSLDDDYIAAASGPHAAEARAAAAQAKSWFDGQTLEWADLFQNPKPDYWEARTYFDGSYLFSSNALPAEPSTPDSYTVIQALLYNGGFRGQDFNITKRWQISAKEADVFHRVNANDDLTPDFLDAERGWQLGENASFVNDHGRVLEVRYGMDVAAELRNVVDLRGQELNRQYIQSSEPFLPEPAPSDNTSPSQRYPWGAKLFPKLAKVQLRGGAYARLQAEQQVDGTALNSLTEFTSYYGVAADGTRHWRQVSSSDNPAGASAIELSFDSPTAVSLRDGQSFADLGHADVGFETYGGQQLLVVSIPDGVNVDDAQASRRKLYFAAHDGVRELVFVEIGQVTTAENMRYLNRLAADSIAQLLHLPALPLRY